MKNRILALIRKVVGTQVVLKKIEQSKKDVLFENRKNQMIYNILHDSEQGITDFKYTDHEIIVSLTSYGKRIHDVTFAIESIMQQSMKANRIILWLDNSFKNQRLPESLIKQQKRGLEILYCTDIGPYKKLIPTLEHFPNDAIVTIDDDAIYDYDLLEHLIIPYLADPSYIYCARMHRMGFSDDGVLLPYNRWHRLSNDIRPSYLNFATGVGGVLYPPNSIDNEVLNEDVYMQICRTADDVWLKAMSILKGTKVMKVSTRNPKGDDYILNDVLQNDALYKKNYYGEMLNDKQIRDVFTKYNIYSLLKDDSI